MMLQGRICTARKVEIKRYRRLSTIVIENPQSREGFDVPYPAALY